MKRWFYARNSERIGPVDASVLRELFAAGQIRPDDLVWEEGMKDWVKAGDALPSLNQPPPEIPVATPNQAWPDPQVHPYPAQARDSSLAIVSLVSGIISLVTFIFCCGILGLVPIVTGHLALREIRDQPGLSGKGMAQAGLIMGYISLSITVLIILFYGIIFAIGLSSELNK
ncbi:MAG: DUF4190 domain-containing protein [Blastochloris sp.]|nr:DUF4190 domain-containing protein [Blastochloris sp.]